MKSKNKPAVSMQALTGLREYTDRTLKKIYEAYAANPLSNEFGTAESERFDLFKIEMKRRGLLQ